MSAGNVDPHVFACAKVPISTPGLDLISGKTRRILVGDFSLCGDSAELWINYAMADARFAILLIN